MNSEIKRMYSTVLKYGETVQGYYDRVEQLQSIASWPGDSGLFYQYRTKLKRFMTAGK